MTITNNSPDVPPEPLQYTRACTTLAIIHALLISYGEPEDKTIARQLAAIRKNVDACAEQTQKRKKPWSSAAQRAFDASVDIIMDHMATEDMAALERDLRWYHLLGVAALMCLNVRMFCPRYGRGKKASNWRKMENTMFDMYYARFSPEEADEQGVFCDKIQFAILDVMEAA